MANDGLMSNDPRVSKLLRALGIDTSQLKKLVVTFEAGEPVIVETHKIMNGGEIADFVSAVERYKLRAEKE